MLVNHGFTARALTRASREDRAFLSEKLQTANWLVKSLQQRAQTILKVASEIVRQQDAFFRQGIKYLRPLTLREVAAAIDEGWITGKRAKTLGLVDQLLTGDKLNKWAQDQFPNGAEIVESYGIPKKSNIEFDNPLAIFHDHPKRRGNIVSLGERPEAAWQEPLAFAIDQIAAHLPALLDEMRLLLGHVVPVGFLEEDHQSASYPHALGTIYLTLHPRPMMMLEALIHEFQHNKLHALMRLGPLLAGDEDLRVASPVRPDPRPLRGVLLAAHAFLPVAELYRRLVETDDPLTRQHWFAERYAEIRRRNREAWRTIQQHAVWTPLSQGLAEELARLDRALSEP